MDKRLVVTRFAHHPQAICILVGCAQRYLTISMHASTEANFSYALKTQILLETPKNAARAILESFAWVGLECDDEIIYQSKRFPLYASYAKKLVEEGKAYYCYMSKEELEELRESQRAQGITPRYDNRYRDFTGTPPSDHTPVIRIKAPLDGEIVFDDGVKGRICVQAKELDDFIILRSNGSPTYNFVVAIDDALIGVTDVIRGDDHTSNTPKADFLSIKP